MMLGYLLASADCPVTVLESRQDFDRDFRGDSLHPYTLDLLGQLGLADRLLALPHHKARSFFLQTPSATITAADYGLLPEPFNYVALMPQARFLTFMAAEAAKLPAFEIRMGAKVTDLVNTGNRTTGVRYRDSDRRTHDLGAAIVVACDGRFSKVRHLAAMTPTSLGATTDLLWFKLPRYHLDPPDADAGVYFGADRYVALLGGDHDWQVGYTLPKGGYPAVRESGLEPIRRFVAERVPWLSDRLHLLADFADTTLLSIDISRLTLWHQPGLLLIGDAAHVISPVGGNGILMAIQDAVAAANHLAPALRTSQPINDEVLAAIQTEREPTIRAVQADQVRIEQQAAAARETGRAISPPTFLRYLSKIPAIRRRAARSNAYGPRPPRLQL
ncbi:FAD-dependent oxidoreductase [Fodinicola feengrottensis]|uniref:FAD-dependent oxidoreductase n=2 Tax=Fodinicola feengrottensis TaxID=435914 RepID=A0ABN2GJU5_9ACTN